MSALSQKEFISDPAGHAALLPPVLQDFQARQPWGLLQLHYGEPSLPYEVGYVEPRPAVSSPAGNWDSHCEARDYRLNRLLLDGGYPCSDQRATLGEHRGGDVGIAAGRRSAR